MRSDRSTNSDQPATSTGRYTWITVWLAVGCAIAILLVFNAVRDYRFVARLLAIQQVRHQMTQTTARVEQGFRRGETGEHPLQSMLEGNLRDGESVTLRDADNTAVDHAGTTVVTAPFTSGQQHLAFAHREPLFRTVSTPAGEFVVEVFALHPPRKPSPATSPPPSFLSGGEPQGPRFLTLEVALPLKTAEASVLAPIRRNLFINLAAALALLLTAILAASGLRSYVKGKRLENQLELARQVQSKLLPGAAMTLPGINVAVMYRPSEEVGGDFYDLFPSEPDGFAALLGDVSGKGLPAALLMGVIHGAVRTAAWRSSAAEHMRESQALNRLVCDRASGNRFASMFWCVYDGHRRTLRYVNAGHCPPFLLSNSDGVLTTKRLHSGGPVLGLLPEAAYYAADIPICPGDLLVMYSDGLVEAADTEGKEFGEERLEQLLIALFTEPVDTISNHLLSAWTKFSPATHNQDDLTFTVIRF